MATFPTSGGQNSPINFTFYIHNQRENKNVIHDFNQLLVTISDRGTNKWTELSGKVLPGEKFDISFFYTLYSLPYEGDGAPQRFDLLIIDRTPITFYMRRSDRGDVYINLEKNKKFDVYEDTSKTNTLKSKERINNKWLYINLTGDYRPFRTNNIKLRVYEKDS